MIDEPAWGPGHPAYPKGRIAPGHLASAAPQVNAADPREREAREALPKSIGGLALGDKAADGERMCSHYHYVAAGHPLYWPEMVGQYDDSDPALVTPAPVVADTAAGTPSLVEARTLIAEAKTVLAPFAIALAKKPLPHSANFAIWKLARALELLSAHREPAKGGERLGEQVGRAG